jgi:hypothetical protein
MGKDHCLKRRACEQVFDTTELVTLRTLILPIRLEIDDATSIEAAAMMDVVKKIDPSLPSCKSNFRLKKAVTHDLLIFVSHYSSINGREESLQWYQT